MFQIYIIGSKIRPEIYVGMTTQALKTRLKQHIYYSGGTRLNYNICSSHRIIQNTDRSDLFIKLIGVFSNRSDAEMTEYMIIQLTKHTINVKRTSKTITSTPDHFNAVYLNCKPMITLLNQRGPV